MPDPPKSAREMSEDERDDFLSELYWAVCEESDLADVPAGVTDLLPGGEVVHGPWQPDDCARVLLRWFDDGLLVLHRRSVDGPPGVNLAQDEARALLQNPGRWERADTWANGFYLVVTDRGERLPANEWTALVTDPP